MFLITLSPRRPLFPLTQIVRGKAIAAIGFAWLALHAAPGEDSSFTCQVSRVKDGDTIVCVDQDRHHNDVRLSGIDAPEKGHKKGQAGQPFAERARDNLLALIHGKRVKVVWHKYDHYHRIVGRIWLDELDVNLAQIRMGYAWAFREYLKELAPEDQQAYLDAEATAKSEGIGLWRDKDPEPPWQWRTRHRQRQETDEER